jgi:hypothetical protein
MSNDHYVARTFLKHFASAKGLLHAYRKADGEDFPCRPADICREANGDTIPNFLSDPAYLGAFRGTFEPVWNHAVAALEARAMAADVKFHIAGYWANLLVCTPTWRRVGVETSNQSVQHTVTAHSLLSARIGKADAKLDAAIKALERGEIRIETEADWVRAHAAKSVLRYAWCLYNADWNVLENDATQGFITSDNPAGFIDPGNRWSTGGPFVRFLSVTPRTCIVCDMTSVATATRDAEPDFTVMPMGTVRGRAVDRQSVDRINTHTAMCAEDLLLCGEPAASVQRLASEFAEHRVVSQAITIPLGKEFLIGSRVRVIRQPHSERLQFC